MAVGVADGFAVGFSMADLLGVGVTGAVVAAADGARLDDPAPPTVLLETSALETPLEATAEEARLLVLAGPVESVPRRGGLMVMTAAAGRREGGEKRRSRLLRQWPSASGSCFIFDPADPDPKSSQAPDVPVLPLAGALRAAKMR